MDERTFTLQDQIAFAKFSGDYNPLHIDPVAARRLMFGAPVVHGIHSLLWALEYVAGKAFQPSKFTVHVTGLMRTINQLASGGLQNIFYPSTTFVDEVPLDMGEYVAAKMAGEMLCEFLQKTLPRTTIARPRLPKMATDQMGRPKPVNCLDPVPVMIQALSSFHDRSCRGHRALTMDGKR
jgi:hypothetical protein